MTSAVISGSGVYTPELTVTNVELVTAYNQYVQQFNESHQQEINAGTIQPLPESSAEFITKASGIVSRHVVEKSGILDTNFMRPKIPQRSDDQTCLQVELAAISAKTGH